MLFVGSTPTPTTRMIKKAFGRFRKPFFMSEAFRNLFRRAKKKRAVREHARRGFALFGKNRRLNMFQRRRRNPHALGARCFVDEFEILAARASRFGNEAFFDFFGLVGAQRNCRI